MENNVVMTTEQLTAHVTWSLDLRSQIHVREENFVVWYPSIQKNFISITEEGICANTKSFKHISEEGYITTWHDHVDEMPKHGYILVIEEGYKKEFGVDIPEEDCRWQSNELFIL